MSSARNSFALGALDGRLWAAGGQGSGGTTLATVEGFRPPETTWWSDTPAVASIVPFGLATALSEGEAGIIARAVGIDCASCGTLIVQGIVEPPPPPPPPVCPTSVTFTLLPGSLVRSEVMLTVTEASTGMTFGPFAVPIGEPQDVEAGKYHLAFSAAPGDKVTSAQRGLNVACGDNLTVKLRFHK
jgi:hypothetical protein